LDLTLIFCFLGPLLSATFPTPLCISLRPGYAIANKETRQIPDIHRRGGVLLLKQLTLHR
jgi:hypothetical protein